MTMIFSLWLAINALASSSNSLTDAQLTLLISTTSPEELREAVAARAALEALSRDCELERELKRVPVACFAEAKLRKQRYLLSSEAHERKVRAYSSLCRQVSRSNTDLDTLSAALRSQTLSVSCRKAVQRRVDDLDYQVGEVRELDRFLK